MKHTKGKWFWSGGELRTKQQGDKSWEGTIVLHHNKPSEEIKANCDLIASAPEMLELLKQLRFDLSKDDCYQNHVADIDSTIAKAEGK